MEIYLESFISWLLLFGLTNFACASDLLMKTSKLQKFVDEVPDMPRINGYDTVDGVHVPKSLRIGMFHKKWKFHRDLPPTPVFAYGRSKKTSTVPGPTIESVQGTKTLITWTNHLPDKHILPWDPTIPTATPRRGIPTVVHLHGGINEPNSDGHSTSWFTRRFQQTGPTWKNRMYHYNNLQHPGTLWYHDHAMGLTRVNLLAGLVGAYIVRNGLVESKLGLPEPEEFDRPLVVFDRSFFANGSIYMNSTGNNPSIHPQWQPEYFGDAIVVNGKAWPYMIVKRRKYRFRIINASNARFFRFYFDNGLGFVHLGSDSSYNFSPVRVNEFLLAPSEIADVVIDFSKSKSDSVVLRNNAPYPYPSGDEVDESNGTVMKFVIEKKRGVVDNSRIPRRLVDYVAPDLKHAVKTRYIAMYEYTSSTDEPTHLYINGKSYEEPATETPKAGTSEIWDVINLTEDNHPLHVHLGLLAALEQVELANLDEFKDCMTKENDAEKCGIEKYAVGEKAEVPRHERGWKNVYKMMPGYLTRILVRFSYVHSNGSYPFDPTADPGYVYHCHILDHEDNVMMRPLKFIK